MEKCKWIMFLNLIWSDFTSYSLGLARSKAASKARTTQRGETSKSTSQQVGLSNGMIVPFLITSLV